MATGAHVAADFMDQVDRAGDVGVDDVPDRGEILVEKGFAEAAPGIGEERLDRTVQALCRGIKFIDAVERREIGLDRFDRGAERAEFAGRLHDLRLVGDDNKIKAVLRATFRQLVADAGRGAGHER